MQRFDNSIRQWTLTKPQNKNSKAQLSNRVIVLFRYDQYEYKDNEISVSVIKLLNY